MSITVKEQSRFDARLPKEQKQLLEKAAFLGGYRNLTDFVMLTAQEKAKEIIKEKEQIIASETDGKLFFDAITNAKKPNKALTNAWEEYNTFIQDNVKK